MFLVVTTIEDGLTEVYCVPRTWVRNNTLLWPPDRIKPRRVDKWRAASVEPGTDWKSIPCIVRNAGAINSFLEGIEKEKQFASFLDTEPEEYEMKVSTETVNSSQPVLANVPSLTPHSTTNVNRFSEDVEALQNSVQILTGMVRALQHTTTEINAKLNKLLANQYTNHNTDDPNYDRTDCNTPRRNWNVATFSFPLKTIEECRRLNAALEDLTFRKEIMKIIFNNIGRNDGEVDGHYLNKLGNEIFTNEVLNKFTYKGISRKGIFKESFCDLKNVMSFFQNVLHAVSPIFDDKRTEKYIQAKLLRHSGSRMKRGILKKSKTGGSTDPLHAGDVTNAPESVIKEEDSLDYE